MASRFSLRTHWLRHVSRPGRGVLVSTRGRSPPNKEMRTCACGVEFFVWTKQAGGPVWHCQCPPCERFAIGVTIKMARALYPHPLARVLRRLVDIRWAP